MEDSDSSFFVWKMVAYIYITNTSVLKKSQNQFHGSFFNEKFQFMGMCYTICKKVSKNLTKIFQIGIILYLYNKKIKNEIN